MGSLPTPATLTFLPTTLLELENSGLSKCGASSSAPGSAGSMYKAPWLGQEGPHLQAVSAAAVYTVQFLTLSCFDLGLLTIHPTSWLPWPIVLALSSWTRALSTLLWSSPSLLPPQQVSPHIHWPGVTQFTNTNICFKTALFSSRIHREWPYFITHFM